jgi:hypothetical protein
MTELGGRSHGIDEDGKPALVRPEVPRGKLLEVVAKLPPCLIGMEAYSGPQICCPRPDERQTRQE